MCQLQNIKEMGIKEPISLKIQQLIFSTLVKLKVPQVIRTIRTFKKTIIYLFNNMQIKKSLHEQNLKKTTNLPSLNLKVGDVVRVRSKYEILRTLDKNNMLERCSFMKEMWQYCETRQTVLKRISYFFDEANYKMKKARNIVLLDGLYCSGNWPVFTHKCDRLCFFFWKIEWLEKIE